MSADIKTTDAVFYHGFINSGGQKMSKSLGNVINPLSLVEEYGADVVRYVLLRHVSSAEDSDLTLDAIREHYTAHLTNGLGNLVARVMKLAEAHLDESVRIEAMPTPREFIHAIDSFEFNKAMDIIWSRITALDERITNEKPFAVVKEDEEKGRTLIGELVVEVYQIGWLLAPFMPGTSEEVMKAVLINKKPENLFPRL